MDPVEKNAAENLRTLLLVRKAVLLFCDDGESEDIIFPFSNSGAVTLIMGV